MVPATRIIETPQSLILPVPRPFRTCPRPRRRLERIGEGRVGSFSNRHKQRKLREVVADRGDKFVAGVDQKLDAVNGLRAAALRRRVAGDLLARTGRRRLQATAGPASIAAGLASNCA